MFFIFFNVLAIFKKYINKIFVNKLNNFNIIYLNNILIYIKDFS